VAERLIEKLDRLGAEAGIKQMTPEVYRFALDVRKDLVAEWPKRPWVGLTEDEMSMIGYAVNGNEFEAMRLAEAKLKGKNNGL